MLGVQNISRRTFLKSAGVTGALVLGANVAPGSHDFGGARLRPTARSIQPNLFVEHFRRRNGDASRAAGRRWVRACAPASP